MELKWSEKYDTGVKKFDDQHKHLFSLTNKLFVAIDNGEGSGMLHDILNELLAYTKTHFEEEEKAMREKRFPLLESHLMEHEKLREQVAKFMENLESGKVVLTGSVLGFLVDWLRDHIAKTDKKYGSYLLE